MAIFFSQTDKTRLRLEWHVISFADISSYCWTNSNVDLMMTLDEMLRDEYVCQIARPSIQGFLGEFSLSVKPMSISWSRSRKGHGIPTVGRIDPLGNMNDRIVLHLSLEQS